MIREATAHKIAAGWYDGDRSALYKLACNADHSILTNLDWYNAVKEVEAIIKQNITHATVMKMELIPLMEYVSNKYYTKDETEGDHL